MNQSYLQKINVSSDSARSKMRHTMETSFSLITKAFASHSFLVSSYRSMLGSLTAMYSSLTMQQKEFKIDAVILQRYLAVYMALISTFYLNL